MVWMALPYTIVLTLVGLLCVEFTLMPVTDWLLAHGWLVTPQPALSQFLPGFARAHQ
ncbi:sodium/proton antiporter [Klebsiella pneumoniae subsp. ozaenae]|uniref:Sodium/proton antiporter n=1 Tax=Klebsiella pneumoniae subsp. ozaenae TaxID=574 RepID=A0A378BGS8_KLEPO|nr:sodium/proton antiporter [Klebsiella pneumoniae subsp. ozaenae]